ncbi:MAG: hypothetical protein M3N26_02535, partial [Pseudomonadota bacterium]|nr:hypothetical protein [Pseudomonadota bacterium]
MDKDRLACAGAVPAIMTSAAACRCLRSASLGLLAAAAIAAPSLRAWSQTVADADLQPKRAASASCKPGGDAAWLTPAEKTCYATTPDYADTMAYLTKVQAAAAGQVKIEAFGKTGEGRDLHIVIVSKNGLFDPTAIHAARRPVVLVQNSIHSGEMDGKDACLALLRDMVISKTQAA